MALNGLNKQMPMITAHTEGFWGFFYYRFSHYYQDATGGDARTLFKAYGILFEVIVTGTAGKFDFVPLMLNIGTGLALLTMVQSDC